MYKKIPKKISCLIQTTTVPSVNQAAATPHMVFAKWVGMCQSFKCMRVCVSVFSADFQLLLLCVCIVIVRVCVLCHNVCVCVVQCKCVCASVPIALYMLYECACLCHLVL